MREESFAAPPSKRESTHQFIDQLVGVMVRAGCQMGVSGRGQDAAVAQDLLHLQQVDACFDQVGCIAVTQTVWRNLFFIPHSTHTLRSVD